MVQGVITPKMASLVWLTSSLNMSRKLLQTLRYGALLSKNLIGKLIQSSGSLGEWKSRIVEEQRQPKI